MISIPTIVGPTASGKTVLSLALAERLPDVEIVSADSRQIYIGMDIGTAKPTPDELSAVPHRMIDIVRPDELYSAGRYAADARSAIADVISHGGMPIVVGGSGFYIQALFHGLGAPAVDPVILDRLSQRGEREGWDVLHAELREVDPEAAAAHSPNNRVKLLRALACWHQTGRPYSVFLAGETVDAVPWRPLYIGIAPERSDLYAHIDRRVLEMLDAGLIRETESLLANGYGPDAPGMKTVGYAEAIRQLAGELTYPEAVALIQQSTRRYAKRQMTWFRRIENVNWMSEPDVRKAIEILEGGMGEFEV